MHPPKISGYNLFGCLSFYHNKLLYTTNLFWWIKLPIVVAKTNPTVLGSRLRNRMAELRVSIKELSAHTDVDYEQVRRVVKGVGVPSKAVLRQICSFLKLDFAEFQRILSTDQMRRKYGAVPIHELPADQDLASLEKAWPTLSHEQRKHISWMVDSFVKENSVIRPDSRPKERVESVS